MIAIDRAGAAGDVPAGKLHVTMTSLEMRGGAPDALPLRPPLGTRIDHVEKPTVRFYRFLYNSVGEPWFWYLRRTWPDERIAETLRHPAVEVHVLYAGGQPAGFAELDRRVAGQVELAYLGLLPDFIGRGLGPYLLDHAVRLAWTSRPDRLWVHTCTLDHPAACRTYERAGFVRYAETSHLIDDPRLLGLIPANVEPRRGTGCRA